MNNNYTIALNHEWDKLIKICPNDISYRLGVEYDLYENKFILLYYNEYYTIDINNKLILNKDTMQPLHIIDSIVLLNYLTYSSYEIQKQTHWLSLKDLPNGGAVFYPAFHKSSIEKIITTFGNNICDFENISIKLEGEPIEYGDKGFVFNILPQIKIAIIIWEGDEEISSNASILFESTIQHLLHIETIIEVGMNLVNKIVKESTM